MNDQSEIEFDTAAPAVAASVRADPSGAPDERIFAARVRLLYSGIRLTAAANLICRAISADSRPGEGSAFTVRLPVRVSPQSRPNQ